MNTKKRTPKDYFLRICGKIKFAAEKRAFAKTSFCKSPL